MQTFLPVPDFAASARFLDRQRLGKQRVECKQILLALTDPSYGWQKHPAVRMWRGAPIALATYGWLVCHEWRSRGYKDSLQPFFSSWMGRGPAESVSWLGDEAFHASHRSNLLRKFPEHYRQFWPDEPMDLPYIWPINERTSDETETSPL